ncbi:MAG: hypothetical protein OXG15_09490 [Gammaproteobacteria bacterium]|nr:hypothetical protein [Gammaproteobacteria bacterium]
MDEHIEARFLFITADDRTGSLEIGGIIAAEGKPVPVGPNADDDRCCVVDLASRHITSEQAFLTVLEAHQRQASYRSHKMDAGLRGNWPHEVHALVELGYRVAVVPSFPDAGRRCKDGVVYIQDVPVLDSPFGSDPLTAPCSSRPMEVLEEAKCTFSEVVVWDANDNEELDRATRRSLDEDRVLVGPSGAVGSYAAHILGNPIPASIRLSQPMLIVCGSLNTTSRDQLDRLDGVRLDLDDSIPTFDDVRVITTPVPKGEITNAMAEAMAQRVAKTIHGTQIDLATLVIVGGDTVAACVGDRTLEVLGTVEAGIPVSNYEGKALVTKGGGIGTLDSLRNIVRSSNTT